MSVNFGVRCFEPLVERARAVRLLRLTNEADEKDLRDQDEGGDPLDGDRDVQ